jgi:hypothetical protein
VNNAKIISPQIIEKEHHEKDSETESPQWGFYVAITPPTGKLIYF